MCPFRRKPLDLVRLFDSTDTTKHFSMLHSQSNESNESNDLRFVWCVLSDGMTEVVLNVKNFYLYEKNFVILQLKIMLHKWRQRQDSLYSADHKHHY